MTRNAILAALFILIVGLCLCIRAIYDIRSELAAIAAQSRLQEPK